MSSLSPRAELRLRVLQIIFHPSRSNDQLVEFVREFEETLFADIELGGDVEAPKAAKKKDAA